MFHNKNDYDKNFDTQLEKVSKEKGYTIDPTKPDSIRELALTLFDNGDDVDFGIFLTKNYMRLISPRIDQSIFRRAIFESNKLEHLPADFWFECSSFSEQLAGQAIIFFKGRNFGEALSLSEELLTNICVDEKIKNIYMELFDFVIQSFKGEVNDCSLTSSSFKPSKKRILFASGMGWSGSGALVDYFKEFPGLNVIEGELPYFSRGKYSLYELSKCTSNEELFDHIIGFIFRYIFGYDTISSCWDYKEFTFTRSNISEVDYKEHKAIIESLKFVFISLRNREPSPRTLVVFLYEHVVIPLISARYNIECDYVVLDNVIPVFQAQVVHLLPRSMIYCTVRDPRSNYAALIKENPTFSMSLDSFVKRYRDQRDSLEKKLNSPSNSDGSIVVVDFEKFVINRSYRMSLLDPIPINNSEETEFVHFKPWISVKNTLLHYEILTPQIIGQIEKDLSRWCTDFDFSVKALST